MTDFGPEADRAVASLRAITCHADPAMRRVLAATVERAGLVVAGEVDRGVDAVELSRRLRPDVVVIDLVLVGTLGLRLISTLREAAPGCLVVALTPFDTLVLAPLEAGAHAVVAENDVRALFCELHRIARSRLSPT